VLDRQFAAATDFERVTLTGRRALAACPPRSAITFGATLCDHGAIDCSSRGTMAGPVATPVAGLFIVRGPGARLLGRKLHRAKSTAMLAALWPGANP